MFYENQVDQAVGVADPMLAQRRQFHPPMGHHCVGGPYLQFNFFHAQTGQPVYGRVGDTSQFAVSKLTALSVGTA